MKLFRLSLAGAAVGAATLAAAAVPTAASAQGYGGYYDPCRNSQRDRSIVGGLLGAGAGIALGNNVTGRDDRDTGRIVGGVLGGLVGAGIGRNTGACAPAYNNYGGGYGYQGGYRPAPAYGYGYGYPQPQPYYAPTYSRPSYGYSDPYAYRGHGGRGGYTYESRTYGTVYPSYGGYGYSQPAYHGGYGY